MTEIKPGTVVKITTGCYDGKAGLVMRITDSGRAMVALHDKRTEKDPRPLAYNITDIRPLVVLDWSPSAPHLQELLTQLRENYWTSLADQLEAQLVPARIPEPGHWAVVKASHKDDQGFRRNWVRHASGQWFNALRASSVAWSELINPELIRPGVDD